jgi:hypothetical protein
MPDSTGAKWAGIRRMRSVIFWSSHTSGFQVQPCAPPSWALYRFATSDYTGMGSMTSANFLGGPGYASATTEVERLVAAVLGGLMSMTVVAAAGEQFIPLLVVREGPMRFSNIPRAVWLHRLFDPAQRARWRY